jgi:uncharacterized protein YbaR (Trm112 family)
VTSKVRKNITTMKKALTDVLACPEPRIFLAWEDTEGMRTKVVALPLNEVSRYYFTAIPVEEGKCRAERRSGDTPEDGLGNYASPAWLCSMDG